MVAWLLDDMLVAFGCVVVGCADRVQEALAIVEGRQVDAAVLDLNLRGTMSYPIADVLLARGIPFIFTTGYPRNRLLEAYRGYPYLLKPYHRSAMRNALVELFPPSVKAA